MTSVRESMEAAVEYLSDHTDEARYTDSVATATLQDQLRVVVRGQAGEAIETDMPGAVGGRGDEFSPGWLFRAATAACVASTVAMEAAVQGVSLSLLEVEVDSVSDDRGILGMDPSIPAGPLSARVLVRGASDDVGPSRLRAVLENGVMRCPVYDATQRAIPVSIEIDTA